MITVVVGVYYSIVHTKCMKKLFLYFLKKKLRCYLCELKVYIWHYNILGQRFGSRLMFGRFGSNLGQK